MSITFDVTNAIVVGTDLSDRAQPALEWAADRAAATDHRLVVILVLPEVPMPRRSQLFEVMQTGDWVAHLHGQAREQLDSIRDRVLARHPDLTVDVEIAEGEASYVLAQATKTADLVVVGARGEHAPAKVKMLGGTADAVVAHSHGPVAVITDLAENDPEGPVVVGCDSSVEATTALDLAVREAVAFNRPLTVIQALDLSSLPESVGVAAILGMSDEDLQQSEAVQEIKNQMAAQLATYLEQHPDLIVNAEVRVGRASTVLAEASKNASLVVVGSRGRGGFAGLLLGSTSRAVLRKAHSPVLVTRR